MRDIELCTRWIVRFRSIEYVDNSTPIRNRVMTVNWRWVRVLITGNVDFDCVKTSPLSISLERPWSTRSDRLSNGLCKIAVRMESDRAGTSDVWMPSERMEVNGPSTMGSILTCIWKIPARGHCVWPNQQWVYSPVFGRRIKSIVLEAVSLS